jgi:hypothetical protein
MSKRNGEDTIQFASGDPRKFLQNRIKRALTLYAEIYTCRLSCFSITPFCSDKPEENPRLQVTFESNRHYVHVCNVSLLTDPDGTRHFRVGRFLPDNRLEWTEVRNVRHCIVYDDLLKAMFGVTPNNRETDLCTWYRQQTGKDLPLYCLGK